MFNDQRISFFKYFYLRITSKLVLAFHISLAATVPISQSLKIPNNILFVHHNTQYLDDRIHQNPNILCHSLIFLDYLGLVLSSSFHFPTPNLVQHPQTTFTNPNPTRDLTIPILCHTATITRFFISPFLWHTLELNSRAVSGANVAHALAYNR